MIPRYAGSFVRKVFLPILLLLLIPCIWAVFWPLSKLSLPSKHPVDPSYESAVSILEGSRGTTTGLIEGGDTQWLLHGHPTDRVFVLLHGLCNCPRQYEEFAGMLYAKGYNVLVPRTPFHGLANLMNTEVANLTAEEMVASTLEAVRLARALGKRVTVVGLSINGTTVAWLAQNVEGIDCAVLLDPFLAPMMIPGWTVSAVGRLALRLPNQFLWWDDKQRERLAGPSYAYPRFSTRVVGQVMRLGEIVLQEAEHEPFRSGSILVITSASDNAASATATASLVSAWKKFRPDAVRTHEFPASERVPHDFIDPNQPDQKVGRVYPVLLRLLEE